ncbi:aminoglycoside phosphotransferase family protein [Shewanella nanhaiensis]|uniref:Aminoglycoside phosphotransferase family protein n=1 Tax=Shewanella nanhaiensis TaxID=2864872 RepID=A0ABS7E5W2_9GAMM|nr:aminoglycoside phosphotransferase family protein [Shewanella nanhaiensis]MBW8185069.1 aminoglycoside phosphotransferase family protein [Shewanella nanhaiensis]
MSILPRDPSYDEACDICDHWQLDDWQPMLAKLIIRHGLTVEKISQNLEGSNPVFELTLDRQHHQEQSYMVKVLAPNWYAQYRSELLSLSLLNQHKLGIKVPKLIYSGEIDNWHYLVIEKLSGTPLSNVMDKISEKNRSEIAYRLGQFSAQLHKLPQKELTELRVNWREFVKKQSQNCFEKRKKQKLAAPLLASLPDYLKHHLSRLDSQLDSPQLYLIHTDLHPGNLMVNKVANGYQLTGIFDFGDALACPVPEFEFTSPALLLALGEPALLHAFLDGYGYLGPRSKQLQEHMMILSLIRHTGDINYLLQHVPNCKDEVSWQALEAKFFPL